MRCRDSLFDTISRLGSTGAELHAVPTSGHCTDVAVLRTARMWFKFASPRCTRPCSRLEVLLCGLVGRMALELLYTPTPVLRTDSVLVQNSVESSCR